MILETKAIPKSWARIFQPRINMTVSDNIQFQFKGKLMDKRAVFARVGVGMEGPNELFSFSAKFGLESNEKGQFSQLVTSDGIVGRSMGIPISVSQNINDEGESDLEKYYLILYNNRLVVRCSDNTVAIITSCLPKLNKIKKGISLGLQTLDAEKKKFLIDFANLYSM